MPQFAAAQIFFDATSAKAHIAHDRALREAGKCVVDLTPAALGPFVVPAVNIEQHAATGNVNMVTCGGQATVPIVAAASQVAASSQTTDPTWSSTADVTTAIRAPSGVNDRPTIRLHFFSLNVRMGGLVFGVW